MDIEKVLVLLQPHSQLHSQDHYMAIHEMKNLGLLFIHKITHPYIMILEVWLDRKAGKKLEPNKS